MIKRLFSAIVVAYNRKDYILDAVKSALDQTTKKDNYEIIVIKNFIDPTIDTFLKKHNILSINSKEQTLSGKISESAQIANGEYLCFLEDDDLWAPNRLSAFFSLLNKFGSIDFYHNNYIHFTSGKQKIADSMVLEKNDFVNLINIQKAKSSIKEFNKLVKNHSSYNLSSMIIKKELVLSNLQLFSGFGNDYVDGLIFYISAVFGTKLLTDRRKFTAVRVHANNRSGIGLGTGSTKYVVIYNYLYGSTNSSVIQKHIHQLLSRIDLDLKIKSQSSILFSILRSYFIHLKDSLRCNRMPDLDMTIKLFFRTFSRKAFVTLMNIYHY